MLDAWKAAGFVSGVDHVSSRMRSLDFQEELTIDTTEVIVHQSRRAEYERAHAVEKSSANHFNIHLPAR